MPLISICVMRVLRRRLAPLRLTGVSIAESTIDRLKAVRSRILIAADDPPVAGLLGEGLSAHGYEGVDGPRFHQQHHGRTLVSSNGMTTHQGRIGPHFAPADT